MRQNEAGMGPFMWSNRSDLAAGLVSRDELTVKVSREGKGPGRICQFEQDAGLLREHEKQAAQELGQWREKSQIGGDEARPVIVKVL